LTTRSPTSTPAAPGPSASTSPSASWPRTSSSDPGGGEPNWPWMISWSVPETPTRRTRTSAWPGPGVGTGKVVRWMLPARPGWTATAVIVAAGVDDAFIVALRAWFWSGPDRLRGGGALSYTPHGLRRFAADGTAFGFAHVADRPRWPRRS